MFSIGDEFVDEDVVVDGVTDTASDDANSERQRSDGGNQILYAR